MVLLSRADDEDAPALEPAAPGRRSTCLLDGRLDGALSHGYCLRSARAADDGIQLVSSQQLDSRLTELTLPTPALRQPTHVRVLLPG